MGHHFNLSKVVLAEPRKSFREEIEAVLRGMGFYDIVSTGNLSAAQEALENDNISLLIADTSLPEGDINDTVKDIRLSKLGGNPFVVCLTMISDPSEEKTAGVINSGVDDLVAKPFPATQIRDRILMLANARPMFVVTSTYIGPSRRDPNRDKETDDLFRVPNPLISSVGMQNYKNALNIIKEHRVVRDGLKIQEISSKVVERLRSGVPVTDLGRDIDWLNETADDLDGRLKDSIQKPIRSMIMTLKNLTAMITNSGEATEDDILTLEQLSRNIASRFDKKRLAFSINEYRSKTKKELEEEKQAEEDAESQPAGGGFFKPYGL